MLNMIAHHPKNKTIQTLTLVNQLTNQSNQTINSAIMLNMTISPHPQEMPQCLTWSCSTSVWCHHWPGHWQSWCRSSTVLPRHTTWAAMTHTWIVTHTIQSAQCKRVIKQNKAVVCFWQHIVLWFLVHCIVKRFITYLIVALGTNIQIIMMCVLLTKARKTLHIGNQRKHTRT